MAYESVYNVQDTTYDVNCWVCGTYITTSKFCESRICQSCVDKKPCKDNNVVNATE